MELIIYSDGGSMNNMGPDSEASWTISIGEDRRTWRGKGTSNEAEYKAMICALHHAGKEGVGRDITIYLDSSIVYHQLVTQVYAVREPRLQELHSLATTLLRYVESVSLSVSIKQVRSEDNAAHTPLSTLSLLSMEEIMGEIESMGKEVTKYDAYVDVLAEMEGGYVRYE